MDVSITAIGSSKGTARVWLQGKRLERAGFSVKTKYQVSTKGGTIMLTKTTEGIKLREVSFTRKKEKEIPVIDINNAELAAMFEGMTQVRVIFRDGEINILPLASEIRAKERLDDAQARMAAGVPLTFGSLAHGGGILSHALEHGFSAESVPTKLVFANEFRDDLMEHVLSHNTAWNKDTISLHGPMQELAFDEWVMRNLGTINLLEAGLPCSGASVAGRAKRALVHAEAHPEVGHLVVAFLAMVMRLNPAVIVLENVPQYQSTASMDIIRNQLRDMGYDVHETIIDGADWNALEHRKRMVMVAVTRGMTFDFEQLYRPAKVERKLSEILEDIALDDARWSIMAGLKAKEIRDAAAGKSFAMQLFDADSTKIGTLTKGIGKNRSTDPKIRHPVDPDLLRIPTALEHARAKDIPAYLLGDLCATTAHELLGQSIVYQPFVSIGSLVAKSFINLKHNDSEVVLQANLITQAVIAKAKREEQRLARMKMI